jgi:hypothetical protein
VDLRNPDPRIRIREPKTKWIRVVGFWTMGFMGLLDMISIGPRPCARII